MPTVSLVISNCPPNAAESIAQALIEQHHAACVCQDLVQHLAGVLVRPRDPSRRVYRWPRSGWTVCVAGASADVADGRSAPHVVSKRQTRQDRECVGDVVFRATT